MGEDMQVMVDRMFYGDLRESTGSPPVEYTKISEDLCVCSIKGEDFEIELTGMRNAWVAKAECILAWREKNDPENQDTDDNH